MKLIKTITTILAATIAFSACDKTPNTPSVIPSEPSPEPEEEVIFAEGADISWLTQYEKEGVKFYNSEGKETECTALMKEIGFDAIRLRVWVNPTDGWCGKEDVLIKAKRAQALGMRIMIDFHYSDSWADPAKQNIPQAWKDYNLDQMCEALGTHTKETLKTLKDNAIDVEWVQIGNEVNSGMLWPMGKVEGNNAANFIKLANAGFDATKEVYPDTKVIIHVSNGYDNNLFTWFFDLMKSGSAKYDMIGMSLYPSWWENGAFTTGWKTKVQQCISNVKSMILKYDKPVMICEIGMPNSLPEMSKEAIELLLSETKKIEKCHGVFYWEPESSEGDSRNYSLGAFRNGKPTIALDPFKD